MAGLMEGNVKEFIESAKREEEYWDNWTRERTIRKCRCGNIYSYGWESNFVDPKICPFCRNALGDIVR
jgi:hypothetical protein